MFDNIKAILSDDTVFFGTLIVLVGISSFGLGRLSVAELREGGQAATVTMTETGSGANRETTERERPNAVDAQNAAGTFVGSVNSDKYHLPWCSGAERINPENQVWFETKSAAEAQGYAPAANCPGL